MPLKLRRIDPGFYVTEVHGEEYRIHQVGTKWIATTGPGGSKPRAEGKTKREVVSRLESLARMPSDREVNDTLKLFRRSLIKKDTQLSVEGIRGKCSFVSYTRKDDGSEWIDIITPQLKSRTVRPEKIKRVHRK